jgi:hypothetical protein
MLYSGSIQELQSGQLSVGAVDIASRMIAKGSFLFRTFDTSSSCITTYGMRVCGIQEKGREYQEMDFEAFQELAKKMVYLPP